MTDTLQIAIGTAMPGFVLVSQDGETVHSVDLVGQGPLVIYFYPKDNTPGCTAEACSFRDQYEDFVQAGAGVVGISRDDPASHRGFADKHRLPFTLLADPDGAVHQAFGVGRTLGLLSGRVTFVVDTRGIVRHRFSSQLRATRHVAEALEVVRRIGATDRIP